MSQKKSGGGSITRTALWFSWTVMSISGCSALGFVLNTGATSLSWSLVHTGRWRKAEIHSKTKYQRMQVERRRNRPGVQLASKGEQQQDQEQSLSSATVTSSTEGQQGHIFFDDDVEASQPWSEGLKEEVYFDIDEACLGDSCDLVSIKDTVSNVYGNEGNSPVDVFADRTSSDSLEKRITQFINQSLTLIPIVTPILAFTSYEAIGKLFEMMIETMAQKNWVAVDGGAYQTKILTPAINGIIVPSISILFATLISNTVATLRQRQLDVRTSLNTEAGEIRVLVSMVDSFPLPDYCEYQDRSRSYLMQYTTRIIAESQSGVKINSLGFAGSLDSEMNGLLAQLNEMNSNNNSDNDRMPLPSHISSESYGAITRLNSLRSTRISALQSTFPPLHYGILLMLAGSICITFLIESNQELLYFLNAVQLKILWTMLIGTFSALAVVCYDLSDPFRGSYQISTCVDQLYTIRDTLRAAAQLKEAASKSE